MTTAGPLTLEALPSVSIESLVEVAELQDRRDRKYFVPPREVQRFLDECVEEIQVLEIDGARAFRYETVYFDTQDVLMYRMAARSRPRRFKVRTRSYVDSAGCALEVKERTLRGRTIKHRFDYGFDDRRVLTEPGLDFVRQFPFAAKVSDDLSPTLTTTYQRITLFLPASASRVTIDLGLRGESVDGRSVELADMAVVETKSDQKPTSIDRALWRSHHRPLRVSKYGTSLAALRPELPANKWHRTLKTYFPGPIVDPGVKSA